LSVAAPLVLATIALGQPVRDLLPGESLDFSARSNTHLTGTFRHDDTVIRFDSVRTGTAIRFELRDAAGTLVYSITSDTKTYKQNFYDGLLRTTGRVPTLDAKGDVKFPPPKLVGEQGALQRFRESKEYRGLPFLSRALAAQEIFGTTYPASLYIHGLGLANLQSGGGPPPPPPPGGGPPPACPPGSDAHPCNNNCFGMCGPNCTCWRWVCGDCCMHKGCLVHDISCQKCSCGFLSHQGDCALCWTAISFVTSNPCSIITGCRNPPSC
jgi:hypothetical protein